MHTYLDRENHISRAAATKCPHCGTRLGQTPPLWEKARKNQALIVAYLFGNPLIFGLAAFILVGVLYFGIAKMLATAYESKLGSACVENLKQIDLALRLYSNSNQDTYPPIDDLKNNFIFTGAIYPDSLPDIDLVVCPGNQRHDRRKNSRPHSVKNHPGHRTGDVHSECLTDRSYCYLGWEITGDEEAEEFFQIYDELSPADYGKDILDHADGSIKFRVLDNPPHSTLSCLIAFHDTEERKGSSEIPVVWDRPYMDPDRLSHRHPDTGEPAGLVLYKDGHIDFVKFGEKFPMTETMARLLEERPREPIPDCEEYASERSQAN